MKGKKVAGLVGDLAPVEAAFALKTLVEGLGGTVECRTDGARLPAGNRSAYVGTARDRGYRQRQGDPADRHQPARRGAGAERAHPQGLDARARRSALIGEAVDLTYDYHHVGTDRAALAALVDRRHRATRPASRRW